MFYIDINNPDMIMAKNNHYKMMRFIIKKKLNGSFFNEKKPIDDMSNVNKVKGICGKVSKCLNDEEFLRKVLIGTPDELDTIKDLFLKKKERDSLMKLINYEKWIDFGVNSTFRFYNAYSLAEKLNISTCIYCNRMYTKTVISSSGKKITRPTFDHWFPKSKFPILQLSFYNLIPSCYICNSGIKGSSEFRLNTHFHPYFRNSNDSELIDYKFSYDHVDYGTFKFKIKSRNAFSQNSVEAFQLEEIYKTHEDEIKDLRRIRDVYSDSYLEILEKHILTGTASRSEVYRLAFGVHFDETKYYLRPLSKMKKDILIELGIIKLP